MMRRPPGFSPFRLIRVQETKQGTTVSPPYIAREQEERDPENEQGPTHGHGWLHEKQIKAKNHHGIKHGHDHGHFPPKRHGLGHGHQKPHGFGHGHQKPHGLGHGHQLKLDYLKHEREDGYDHRHTVGHGHGLGHGHGNGLGLGHGKHTNKDKNNVKHTDQRTEPLTSSSEDSTTSTQIQERTEGPTLNPPLAQPTVISSGFQDSDFIEGVVATTPPYDTEIHDDLIPDIHVQPDSLSFKLITDFPEAASHKCPGRPWKPVSWKDPTTETTEFSDFDLLDALS